MDLQRPFRLVGPTLDGDVLSVLARGDVALTGRAIARALPDASYTGVRHALRRLADGGIVRRQSVGRAYLYQLNRDHLAAPWIEGLASLRLELIDRLRAAIAGWKTPPTVALLFGSSARGDADRDSDIDVLVIRPSEVDEDDTAWREQLMGLEAAASAWTGNDARILEYGEHELAELADVEPPIRAAAQEGIELFGSRRALRPTRRRITA